MVKGDLVAAGKFDEIEVLTREAVNTMLGFELKHVGINCADENEADSVASSFDQIFGFAKKAGNSSIFAGTAIEAMKAPGAGAKGHIAIQTNYIERAVNYLESQGFAFDYDSVKPKEGPMKAIYLKEEIGGFAVHLVEK